MSGTNQENPLSLNSIELKNALEERYLSYALSTIMNRALPDVRDGLKPVHRRILYAMRLLKLDPKANSKKSARIVGDVIGRYHPHGEQAVYDALVRLAQDFSVRYPLIDGQGNFGNVDGDNAAAMRYTEAKFTPIALELLDGLDEDTVDFKSTYDEEDEEPLVLPAGFPNLLANGTSGIAVGMATSIPPHNLIELCQACLLLIQKPTITIEEIVEVVPAPDFPTGGILVEPKENIIKAYETGKGSFRLRARWHKEPKPHGNYQIVISEIPYQVAKSRLIEKMAELLNAKKLPLLGDIRDESSEDVRIILEPRNRSVNPDLLMETIFKACDLQVRVSLNLNVLCNGQIPKIIDLKTALKYWLEHRKEVLQRRKNFRLDKINKRLEILEGLLVAYLNLDEVIRIIRYEDEPKETLIKAFTLSDNQAEAILNTRLRALRKLEEFKIKEEHQNLIAEKENIETLLSSDRRQWTYISKEIKEIIKKSEDDAENAKRKTDIGEAPTEEMNVVEAFIEREPITVILTHKGWIKALRGHIQDISSLSFKEGDTANIILHAQTTDKLLAFSTNGKFFTIQASNLPGGRGQGDPLRLMIDIDETHDIIDLHIFKANSKKLISSKAGYGFIVKSEDLIANTRKGKQILNVKSPDEAAFCTEVVGDKVAIIGENRKLLLFPAHQITEMAKGKGVRLQKYRQGSVSDLVTYDSTKGFYFIDKAGRKHFIKDDLEWRGDRALAGRLAPRGFPASGKFCDDNKQYYNDI